MNKGIVATFLLVALMFLTPARITCAVAQSSTAGSSTTPAQPIAFSPKGHAGTIGLSCSTCHQGTKTGQSLTIPQAPLCMQCHQTIATDKPEIQRLSGFSTTNQPISWVRVYGIPSFVRFSHQTHLDKGNTCKECHGAVETRDSVFAEVDLSMPGCLSCHNAKQASTGCEACHTLDQTFLPRLSPPTVTRAVSHLLASRNSLHAYLMANMSIFMSASDAHAESSSPLIRTNECGHGRDRRDRRNHKPRRIPCYCIHVEAF